MNQWQKMICDLREKGLTQTQIATEIGCSQNYVSDLERGLCGKRLSYDLGRKLENLWKKNCLAQSITQEKLTRA
ncbi:helix-turn-helix domain-containing protein [Acinetobacter baumannii]|nr:helix-turn-helix domain-containing protein [Acinetobacter baumannii]